MTMRASNFRQGAPTSTPSPQPVYQAPTARPGGAPSPAGVRPAVAGGGQPVARPAGPAPAARPGGAPAPAARPGGAPAPVARPAGPAPAARPGGVPAPAARPQTSAMVPAGQAPAPVVPYAGDGANIVDLNQDFQGLDAFGGGGVVNRITVDGSNFLFKATNQSAPELYVNLSGGQKMNQAWIEQSVDTANGPVIQKFMCQSFDGKTAAPGSLFAGAECATCAYKQNKECRLKYELKWYEPQFDEAGQEVLDDEQNPVMDEMVMTLSTSSTYRLIDYTRELAKVGLGLRDVITRCYIERKENEKKKGERYSVVHFQVAEYLKAPVQQ